MPTSRSTTADNRWVTLLAPWLCLGVMASLSQAREHASHAFEQRVADAAHAFLDTLSPDLQDQATFEFDSDVRKDWHFFPKERVGVSWKEMSVPQRRAAHALLRSTLSSKGYLKAISIMQLEAILQELEGGPEVAGHRDPEKYWFSIFGDPVAGEDWGWRVEGHHLSVNVTASSGSIIATTPLFLGANPAEVPIGTMAGTRVLGDVEDLARRLVLSMEEEMRSRAIIDVVAPREVITVPEHAIDVGQPVGVRLNQMTGPQKRLLRQLIRELATTFRPEIANPTLAEIREQGGDQIYFAWAGGLSPDEGHYYRIHGASFVVEYDNTQNDVNHVHAVWHSLQNNFGLDTLSRHYKSDDHGE